MSDKPDPAFVYCPDCGLEFDCTELRLARKSISNLATIRDEQADALRLLRPEVARDGN